MYFFNFKVQPILTNRVNNKNLVKKNDRKMAGLTIMLLNVVNLPT